MSVPARCRADPDLAAGEVASVTIQLEPTASITGTVFAPDGQTPLTSGTAAILAFNGYYQQWLVCSR